MCVLGGKVSISPYTPNPIAYSKDNQAMTLSNTSPLLDAAGKYAYHKLLAVYFTTPEQSTQPFSWHCLQSQHNKVPQLKKHLCG